MRRLWRGRTDRHLTLVKTDLGDDGWTQAADAISVPQLDEVNAHPRPAGLVTYAEDEYAKLASEQDAAWNADGEYVARSASVEAAELEAPAEAAQFLLREQEKTVIAAHADHRQAVQVLQPYVRRAPGAKLRYWIGWPLFAIGDASSVLSALVVLGDVPWIAAGQALSSGLAAACAGLVGGELKDRQLARERHRDPETLTEDETSYRHLFVGAQGSSAIVKLIACISMLLVLLLAVAVFLLRASIEGNAAGVTFGLLTAATALGSGVLGYAAADDVADLLETKSRTVRHAEARLRHHADARAVRVRAAAVETARSVVVEYEYRGQAAVRHVESLSSRVARNNPQVYGHGWSFDDQPGIVGRRPRRGDQG